MRKNTYLLAMALNCASTCFGAVFVQSVDRSVSAFDVGPVLVDYDYHTNNVLGQWTNSASVPRATASQDSLIGNDGFAASMSAGLFPAAGYKYPNASSSVGYQFSVDERMLLLFDYAMDAPTGNPRYLASSYLHKEISGTNGVDLFRKQIVSSDTGAITAILDPGTYHLGVYFGVDLSPYEGTEQYPPSMGTAYFGARITIPEPASLGVAMLLCSLWFRRYKPPVGLERKTERDNGD